MDTKKSRIFIANTREEQHTPRIQLAQKLNVTEKAPGKYKHGLRLFSILTISVTCLLNGCGSKAQLPDDPIIYEQGENEDEGYSYLTYGDKMFVPYCAYKTKYLGDCIGYCDLPAYEYTDVSRVYIFELKGYSSDEWIIESLELDNCSEGMILREINTTNIPDGLESEYGWND